MDAALALLLLGVLLSELASFDVLLAQRKIDGVIAAVVAFSTVSGSGFARRRIRAIMGLVVICGVGIGFLGLLTTAWLSNKGSPVGFITARLPSIGNAVAAWQVTPGSGGIHPNELGGTLAMLIPFGVASAMTSERGCRRGRIVLWACTAAMATVLVLTQSRSAYFAAMVACGAVVWGVCSSHLRLASFWRAQTRGARLASIGALLVLVLGAGVGVARWPNVGPGAYLRVVDSWSGDTGNGESRAEIWKSASTVIADLPITGTGFEAFPIVVEAFYPPGNYGSPAGIPHAHNVFLQTAVEVGLPGALGLFALLGTGLTVAYRARRAVGPAGAAAIGCGASLLAYAVFGLTDSVSLGAKPGIFLWTSLGILRVVASDERSPRRASGVDALSHAGQAVLDRQPVGSVTHATYRTGPQPDC